MNDQIKIFRDQIKKGRAKMKERKQNHEDRMLIIEAAGDAAMNAATSEEEVSDIFCWMFQKLVSM